MARSQAKVFVTIWASDDWRALSLSAQWLYLLLLSQSRLNLAGCIDLMPTRWAALAPDVDLAVVRLALAELERRHFVVIDQETGEVVVRSFTVHDLATGALNRNLVKGFWSAWDGILSARLRKVVVDNLPSAVWERSEGLIPDEAGRFRTSSRLELQSEPRLELQSPPQIEPTAYRLPLTATVTTAVESCANGTPKKPTSAGGGVIVEAARLVATAEADRRGDEIGNRPGYIADRTPKLRAEHEPQWVALLQQQPTATAEQLAAAVLPSRRSSDPLEQAAIAQRKRDQRLAARARGEACPTCDGIGVVDNGDGTFTRCPDCQA